MIQRLGDQPVVVRQPPGGVARITEDPPRFGECVSVEPNQLVPQPDVGFRVIEFTVRRPAQIVNGPVLMKQPGDLVRMPHEIRRKFRCDRQVDSLAVGLREIDHPPCGRMRQQLLFRIPLERHRYAFGFVAAGAQLVHQSGDVQLRPAVHERHLRFTDNNGANLRHSELVNW